MTENQKLAEKMALSLMARADKELNQYNYRLGIAMEFIWRTSTTLHHPEWKDWVAKWMEQFVMPDGTVPGYDQSAYSWDLLAPGKNFFDLYDYTHDERYKKAMDFMWQEFKDHPRTPSGGYWHKKIYTDQVWLDGLYMYGTFLIKYAKRWGDLKAAAKEMLFQFNLTYEHTLDPRSGLLFHAWNETKQMASADQTTGCSSYIWGRALGWFTMALVEVCDLLPSTKEFFAYRARLIELSNHLAQALVRAADKDTGMWWQVVDQPGRTYNYLETSCTSMYIYFLSHMVRQGYAYDPALYRKVARRAFSSMVRLDVYASEDGQLHLKDICKSAGLGRASEDSPYRDGSYEYYTRQEPRLTDNTHGTPAFLLAAAEL